MSIKAMIKNKKVNETLKKTFTDITEDDLKFIMCDGKQCNPVTCLRPSCKVFEYWRNKDDSKK